MRKRVFGGWAAASLCIATGALAQGAPQPAAQSAAQPPKLVVVIVVDQFGANLFNQNRARFTGGLATLASEGLVYANGYQTHGMTETCPGHSTVLTGVHPNRTGIAANDWIDRATGKQEYCLAAPRNRLADGGKGDNGPVGPDNLRATGMGDWLKAASPRSRVFAVSGKDRGAINLAGARPDGAFWYTEGFGFTTYLRPGEQAERRLQPVAELNARVRARMKAAPPSWSYTRAECRTLAGDWPIAGEVFRSDLPPARFTVDNSPLLDELTLEAAETLVREQSLGQGPAMDLLGVSLSGTDRVGHRYGTQGPEMCEQLHRMDAALGRFLDLVRTVPGGALVVLTADHGGSDFTERMALRGYSEARRIDPGLVGRLNATMRTRFALGHDPLTQDGPGLFVLGPDKRALPEARRAEIARATAELLRAEPDVAGAFTVDELAATPSAARSIAPEELSLRERMALSNVPGRSPDVQFALGPGMSPFPGRVGGYLAGHGTPWDYDRRVPIIFWRTGSAGQERALPIRTVDIAPTLAHAAGLPAPAGLDGRCLDLDGPAGAPCPAW
jgi:predicted AlkP superfamily pyrophosphatase or phosphodiesterase